MANKEESVSSWCQDQFVNLENRRVMSFGLNPCIPDLYTLLTIAVVIQGHEAIYPANRRLIAIGGRRIICEGNFDVEEMTGETKPQLFVQVQAQKSEVIKGGLELLQPNMIPSHLSHLGKYSGGVERTRGEMP